MSKFPMPMSRCGRLLTASLLFPFCTYAANVDWDGNGAGNNDGTWETDSNWTGDAKPTASDNARLLDVTSGTREVTISDGSPQTINKLTITQTTVGAFNVLNVDDDLTISGNSTPFVITPTAGPDSIVTNIAAGKTLLATNTGSLTVNFGSELNLAAGSVFKLRAIGATADMTSPTFSAINASGAGAQVILQPDRFVSGTGGALFNGAITVSGSGSTLDILRLTSTDTVTGMASTFSGDDGLGNAINVGDGAQLTISTIRSTATFNNRVSVGVNGVLNINQDSNGGAATNNFNGGLVLGAGAEYTVIESSTVVTLDGTSSMGTGSVMTLKYTGTQAQGTLTNNGSFTMDGADVIFDWAASGNNNGTRGFINNGDWTLKNGSSIALISSTGKTSILGGFGNFRNVSNTGTFSVESGSTVGFESMLSTGTINLGSSTLGVSDSEVIIGSPANTFTNIILNNGYTTGDSTLNVRGDTFIGRGSANGTIWLDNGTDRTGTNATGGSATTGLDSSTGNVIDIGDGTVVTKLTLGNGDVVLSNATGNTVNLNNGATLLLKSTYSGSSSTGAVSVINSGTFNHTGTLQYQGNFNGSRTFTNKADSTYRINGTSAVIESLSGNASGSNVTTVNFTSSGLITGASAHDSLSYINSTGGSSFSTLSVTVTNGEITPGNGTGGSGASSIGELEFSNVNISLAGTTKVSFDIGGLGNDDAPFEDPFVFDYILMESLTFSIGSDTGSVLDIRMANNGFVTPSEQSYVLIDASGGSVTGTFSTLLFEGVAVTDQYTVSYLSDRFVITLAAGLGNASPIPEPSTATMLAGLGVIAFACLRRRRCV